MNAVERRQEIVRLITTNDEAMSGSMLAKELDVSRQVIVQDIALLKAAGYEILSTNKGYVINDVAAHTRVFKVSVSYTHLDVYKRQRHVFQRR